MRQLATDRTYWTLEPDRQKTYADRFFCLLRNRDERPHDCPTAEKRDELAPLHVSRGLTLFSPLKPAICDLSGEGHPTERLFLGRRNVRFGSKADICAATSHVRFTPESDIKRDIGECPLWAISGHA